jgi:hypothetical protein
VSVTNRWLIALERFQSLGQSVYIRSRLFELRGKLAALGIEVGQFPMVREQVDYRRPEQRRGNRQLYPNCVESVLSSYRFDSASQLS